MMWPVQDPYSMLARMFNADWHMKNRKDDKVQMTTQALLRVAHMFMQCPHICANCPRRSLAFLAFNHPAELRTCTNGHLES